MLHAQEARVRDLRERGRRKKLGQEQWNSLRSLQYEDMEKLCRMSL